jgi:hypothetical protein
VSRRSVSNVLLGILVPVVFNVVGSYFLIVYFADRWDIADASRMATWAAYVIPYVIVFAWTVLTNRRKASKAEAAEVAAS